jgi:hypothetical protein
MWTEKEEVNGEWKELNNEEIHYIQSMHFTIRVFGLLTFLSQKIICRAFKNVVPASQKVHFLSITRQLV